MLILNWECVPKALQRTSQLKTIYGSMGTGIEMDYDSEELHEIIDDYNYVGH